MEGEKGKLTNLVWAFLMKITAMPLPRHDVVDIQSNIRTRECPREHRLSCEEGHNCLYS